MPDQRTYRYTLEFRADDDRNAREIANVIHHEVNERFAAAEVSLESQETSWKPLDGARL